MHSKSLTLIGCLGLLASLTFPAYAQETAAARVSLDGRRFLGAPKTFRNLTLIPVFDPTARASQRYMTLDEGLRAKVVKVKEAKDGGEVNTLFVSNHGPKPLYIMAGEVVLGGQQDRCLGRDLVIAPGKRDVPISVFCVEHGRWTGRGEFEGSANMVASAGIRADAQNGAFASAKAAPTRIARASSPALQANSARVEASGRIVSEAQEKVWDKVAKKNKRFKAESNTGTYRNVLNLAGGNAHSSVTPYLNAFAGTAKNDAHLVGMLAAVNGKPVAADIFGDPGLFQKLWPKLLRSYAADAAENAPTKGKKTPAVTAKMGKEFYTGAYAAKTRDTNKSDVDTSVRLESKSALVYRLQAAKPAASGFQGGGGQGGLLHENVLKKE